MAEEKWTLDFIFSQISDGMSTGLGALIWNWWSQGEYRKAEEAFLEEIKAGNIKMEGIFADLLGVGVEPDVATGEPGGYLDRKQGGLDEQYGTTSIGRAEQLAKRISAIAGEHYGYDVGVERYGELTKIARAGLIDIPGRLEADYDDVQKTVAATQETFETDAESILAGYEGRLDTARDIVSTTGASVVEGYEERLARARGEVSTLGTSERASINQIMDEELARGQSDLLQRGFGGTLATSSGVGVARERASTLGELEEVLAQMRLSVEETFGADVLRAEEGYGQAALDVEQTFGGDLLEVEGQLAQLRTGLSLTGAGYEAEGASLFASTSLGTYGTLANVGAAQYQAGSQSQDALVEILMNAGQSEIDAKETAASIYAGWAGGQTLAAPTPPDTVQPLPYGGG